MDLAAKGIIRPVIDSRYPLEQIAEAHRRVDTGHKVGSVVVTVGLTVRAAVYDRYGTFPEIREVPKPVPGESDVLVRVHASSVNSWDWDEYRGLLANKKSAPRHPILGADVAGVVEAVGAGVTRFKPGDAVFGDLCEGGWGGFGEYVAADEKWFALKPEAMSFAEAAAIPQAGMLALQALREAPGGAG